MLVGTMIVIHVAHCKCQKRYEQLLWTDIHHKKSSSGMVQVMESIIDRHKRKEILHYDP